MLKGLTAEKAVSSISSRAPILVIDNLINLCGFLHLSIQPYVRTENPVGELNQQTAWQYCSCQALLNRDSWDASALVYCHFWTTHDAEA